MNFLFIWNFSLFQIWLYNQFLIPPLENTGFFCLWNRHCLKVRLCCFSLTFRNSYNSYSICILLLKICSASGGNGFLALPLFFWGSEILNMFLVSPKMKKCITHTQILQKKLQTAILTYFSIFHNIIWICHWKILEACFLKQKKWCLNLPEHQLPDTIVRCWI